MRQHYPLQRVLRKAIKRAILPGAPSVRRLPFGIGRGLRMTVDFQAGMTGLYLGLYEVELNRHLRALCRPGYRSFDVGAEYGYDALVLAKLSGAQVITIECDPELCDKIGMNVSLNQHLAPLISVRQAFITARTAQAEARLSLDDLASTTFLPDFMKIDIEGGESDALQGSHRILSVRKPNLLIEVHGPDQEAQCLQTLGTYGYRPAIVNPRKWLSDYRPISHNRWLVAFGRN